MTTSHDAGDSLLRILTELDELMTSARSVPMSGSVIVNRDAVRDLVQRARDAVPTAVRQAEEIIADADAVLAQGREEAERLVRHAQEEAERLASSEHVVRMANDRADAIVNAAEDQAAALRHGADEYSDEALAALETQVARISEQVRAGREVLAGRLGTWDGAGSRDVAVGEIEEPVRRRAGWVVDPEAARG